MPDPRSRAATIDDVVEQLDEVIARSAGAGSRSGYFAALYRKVTVEVRDRIAAGFFDDNRRMERLDVTFANRYLDALESHLDNRPTTSSWRVAFDASERRGPIVLQHLLVGMNAHINLDLGIAAAETAPGDEVGDLEDDFNKINAVLADLTAGVQRQLAEVWPRLTLLDRIAGRSDDRVIHFSIERARDHAWSVATRLAPLNETQRDTAIERVDGRVALLGRRIVNPGFAVGAVTRIVRLGERGTVGEIIEILR